MPWFKIPSLCVKAKRRQQNADTYKKEADTRARTAEEKIYKRASSWDPALEEARIIHYSILDRRWRLALAPVPVPFLGIHESRDWHVKSSSVCVHSLCMCRHIYPVCMHACTTHTHTHSPSVPRALQLQLERSVIPMEGDPCPYTNAGNTRVRRINRRQNPPWGDAGSVDPVVHNSIDGLWSEKKVIREKEEIKAKAR